MRLRESQALLHRYQRTARLGPSSAVTVVSVSLRVAVRRRQMSPPGIRERRSVRALRSQVAMRIQPGAARGPSRERRSIPCRPRPIAARPRRRSRRGELYAAASIRSEVLGLCCHRLLRSIAVERDARDERAVLGERERGDAFRQEDLPFERDHRGTEATEPDALSSRASSERTL